MRAQRKMNLSLLDPFQSDLPEIIEECLEHGITKCIAFNRRGTLLAAGCADGACIIWDFDTRGIAKELRDKDCTASITSISWSKNGCHLLVAATDKSLSLWDVVNAVKIGYLRLQQTALYARFHPGYPMTAFCLACPVSSAPILVDFSSGMTFVLPVKVSKTPEASYHERSRSIDGTIMCSPAAACFNKKGDLIYIGNNKGEILIVDTESRQVLNVVKVPGGSFIRQIVLNRSGEYLLTNSNDRIIRVFENLLPRDKAAETLAELVKNNHNADSLKSSGSQWLSFTKDFQDAVNRMHWKAACFNGDGEYVVGASAVKGEHKIHIWNRKFGQLTKILEGPKEGLTDLSWHPTRPILASVSMSGTIYLWAKEYTENWSAFAPDFKELEENEEYVEREDEFDLMPDIEKFKPTNIDEDEEVDIMTTEKVAAFSDSDDSENGIYFLPTTPLPDTPEHQNPLADIPTKFQNSGASETGRSPLTDDDENTECFESSNFQNGELAGRDVCAYSSGNQKRKLPENENESSVKKVL